MNLPEDYAERVYAGVLGKTIGVYLGRPFEGWPYELIQSRLGDIEYYVHDQVGVPLIVPDDDIAGTFTFPRALADHGFDADLSSAQIGRSWLNYLIEGKTVFWWGGLGNSTEHTAYLRLKSGIPAPQSGSAELNSQIVAEQIGAQIFIDGWAMLCPGRPEQAAKLATAAARVSHDGEAVHGAVVLAVMEAMAFVEPDTNKLIDTALNFVPADSTIRKLIDDVRTWRATEHDWRANRERLAAQYGYDKFGGNCHMVPNHGLIILSLVHGQDDFSETMKIVNTSGWDTDCNSGNVGCLMGIKNGLAGIDAGLAEGRDWRTPFADRIYISAADPSWGISDCVSEAQALINTASRMHSVSLWQPKDGAQFHFEMPGSQQGFTVTHGAGQIENVTGVSSTGKHALQLRAKGEARFGTPVFLPSAEVAKFSENGANPYPIMATPRVYPGQTLRARLVAGDGVAARLYVAYYDEDDEPQVAYSESTIVNEQAGLVYEVPAFAHPAYEIGVATNGTVALDYMRWHGEPDYTTTRANTRKHPQKMARRAWVDGIDDFVKAPWVSNFRLVQNRDRGLLIQGNRDWQDIAVTADVCTDMAANTGVAVRVQGLRRYYGFFLSGDGAARLTKVLDDETVLASTPFDWSHGTAYELCLSAKGSELVASVDGRVLLTATDVDLASGGMALVVEEGCSVTQRISVSPS